jgi:hypothetical protein
MQRPRQLLPHALLWAPHKHRLASASAVKRLEGRLYSRHNAWRPGTCPISTMQSYRSLSTKVRQQNARTNELESVSFRKSDEDVPTKLHQSGETSDNRITGKVRRVVDVFLPKSYQHTVREGYVPYAAFQLAANTLSCAGGVLSMQVL